MVSPSFYVGLMCSSIERLREAIIEYSVRNTVEIKMARNDKIRVRAHCAEIRPQNLYASYDTRAKYFVVKTYYGKYNCKKEWSVRRCSATWIARKYVEHFRTNNKLSITSFHKVVEKELNLTVSRSTLARAKNKIMQILHGDEANQFSQLYDYGHELRRSNPRSSLYVNPTGNLFRACYMPPRCM